jgi:hypothetical protein
MAASRAFALSEFLETDIASATTCNIGAVVTLKVRITGVTTITSLGTQINKWKLVRFGGILTLTYNATSLILPGNANITTAANDTAMFVSDPSGNWTCWSYQRRASAP